MPRLSQSVPKYRRHTSGQARVRINGHDHYLGPYGTNVSRVEYDRLIGEWLSSGRSPTYGEPDHVVTVLQVIVAYLEHAEGYYGNAKRGEYANILHAVRPLRQLYSRLAAREFTPQRLKAVREKFIARGNSRKYINSLVQRIGRMFRWAVSEGLVPPEVPQALSMLPGLRRGHTTARECRKVRPVADKLVTATLPHLSPVVRAMVELQQATGMRPGELVIMTPDSIVRSTSVWEYRPSRHKNQNREQERAIYIGPKAQATLLPFLLRDAQAFCFSPAEAVANQRVERNAARKTPISCGNTIGTNRKPRPKRQAGERYTSQSYNYAIRRACLKAFPVPVGMAEDVEAAAKWQAEHTWSPNQLRHALATKVRRDYGIEAAKVLLGHSQVNMTGHYAELDRQLAIEVTKLIG